MINYFIEFALIHLLLFTIYKLLLRQETQVAFLRYYLLAATLLALVIPLVQLPNLTPVQNLNLTGQVSALVLPEVAATTPAPDNLGLPNLLLLAYSLISLFMVIRFVISLGRILVIYNRSEPWPAYAQNVRHFKGLDTSFTFFNLIFIDKEKFTDPRNIIRHEAAHIIYGHSYDLLLLNLLLIPFWWVPSLWLAIKELKQVHEFQADAYALANSTEKNYRHTLISHTLKQHGFILTNSFNDTPLTKRLDYMKQLKKKISPWKVSGIVIMLLLTAYTFSCQDMSTTELDDEIITNDIDPTEKVFQLVDEPPVFTGGPEAFYEYVNSTLKYTEEALANKVSGRVFVQFIIKKDGTISNVKVLRGIGYGLDEEAKRVIANSPAWTPGKQKGHLVNVRLVVPITFRHPDSPAVEQPAKEMEQVKDMPVFEGGIENFYNYVLKNINYPEEALAAKVSGTVFVQFIVKADGSLSDVKVVKGLGFGLDEEALRIVENSPDWQPAKVDGKLTEVKMVLPINFFPSE